MFPLSNIKFYCFLLVSVKAAILDNIKLYVLLHTNF